LDDEVVDISDDEKKVKAEDDVAADKLIQPTKPKARKAKAITVKENNKNFM
jgi:hypothetical protein